MNEFGPLSFRKAVSVITCTKRPECMERLFRNYARQAYPLKELIVIVNHSRSGLDDYYEAARYYPNVRIYRLPESVTLGECLNFGVRMSRFPYIAKFDDDDYYAPHYLSGSLKTMERSGADIVGKRAHFMYLEGSKALLLRHSEKANRSVSQIPGATLLVKRHVFEKVAFPRRNLNETVGFCLRSLEKGFRIYSGDPYDFLAIRRPGSKGHTWKVSDRALLNRSARIVKAKNVFQHVSRRI